MSPLVMYSSAPRSGSNCTSSSLIADSSPSEPASAVKIPWSGVRVKIWLPCGYSSSWAAVWSFFSNAKSTASNSFSMALVSGSEAGPVPR